jgi:hypothetical protein
MNLVFELMVNNKYISRVTINEYPEIVVPTLKISNKELFDKLLVKYVILALDFYSQSNFAFLEDAEHEERENYLIKYIICTLFANASYDDFYNPIYFLNSRINMFESKTIEGDVNLGTINSIGADIHIYEEESPIKSETPYRIRSYLEYPDGYKLDLPEIYMGYDGEKYILYAIQKTSTSTNYNLDKPYIKQIRKGFVSKINGAPEHYFLAVMLFLAIAKSDNIEVMTFLPERWNAKLIASYFKVERDSAFSLIDAIIKQEELFKNINETMMRYFTKLNEACPELEITSYPFDNEEHDRLHIKIHDNFKSQCIAFNELNTLVDNYNSKSLKK